MMFADSAQGNKSKSASTQNSSLLEDVIKASERLDKYVIETPLIESLLLNEQLGFRLLIKAENMQQTGSFKLRGAFNQMLQLTHIEKNRGVIAMSSGNHAQAVAYAAQKMNLHATVVMPHDAPKLKIRNTRALGAEIMYYDREVDDREEICKRLEAEKGLYIVHSSNARRTIVGQATVGVEIHRQSKARNISPDAIIANCCGGGLASGIAITRDLYSTPPAIYTAEPELFNDMQRSLESGTAMQNDRTSGSICDSLLIQSPGSNTLPILLQHKARGLAACDEDVKVAMSLAAEYFDLILEPGAAVALACACLQHRTFRNKTVIIIASGGNIDSDKYKEMILWGSKNKVRLINTTKENEADNENYDYRRRRAGACAVLGNQEVT